LPSRPHPQGTEIVWFERLPLGDVTLYTIWQGVPRFSGSHSYGYARDFPAFLITDAVVQLAVLFPIGTARPLWQYFPFDSKSLYVAGALAFYWYHPKIVPDI